MDVLTGLLFMAFAVAVAAATVFRTDAKRMERERDDALGRAVQAESAANRLFDRYSEVTRERLESKTPTLRKVPSVPPIPRPTMPAWPPGCRCSSPRLIYQQPGDRYPTRCTKCGQYRAPEPKGAA